MPDPCCIPLPCDRHDAAFTRWIALSSGLSAHKLASMCGAHPDDVRGFLAAGSTVSLTFAIRARMREQIAAQSVAEVPAEESLGWEYAEDVRL